MEGAADAHPAVAAAQRGESSVKRKEGKKERRKTVASPLLFHFLYPLRDETRLESTRFESETNNRRVIL